MCMPEETGVTCTSGLGTEGEQKSPRLSINQLKVQVEEILFRNGWIFCHSGSFSLECSCCNRRQPLYLVVCLELLFQNQTPTEGQLALCEQLQGECPTTTRSLGPRYHLRMMPLWRDVTGSWASAETSSGSFFQGKFLIDMMLKSLSWMRRHFSCSTSLSNRMPYK